MAARHSSYVIFYRFFSLLLSFRLLQFFVEKKIFAPENFFSPVSTALAITIKLVLLFDFMGSLFFYKNTLEKIDLYLSVYLSIYLSIYLFVYINKYLCYQLYLTIISIMLSVWLIRNESNCNTLFQKGSSAIRFRFHS